MFNISQLLIYILSVLRSNYYLRVLFIICRVSLNTVKLVSPSQYYLSILSLNTISQYYLRSEYACTLYCEIDLFSSFFFLSFTCSRAAFVNRKNTAPASPTENSFSFAHFVQNGYAGAAAQHHYTALGLTELYTHAQVGVWFFDYLEFLDCHGNSTSTGYDAWSSGVLQPNIKYKNTLTQEWGPNQVCEFQPGAVAGTTSKHSEVAMCLTHTALNVKAADQLCRESKSNQQVVVDRSLCYLDYKQLDQCNPEVCNGAPRPRMQVYATEEYQFRAGRGVDYVDTVGDLGAYTASGQYVVKRAPADQYVAPPTVDLTAAAGEGEGEGAAAAGGGGGGDNSVVVEETSRTSATGPRVDRFSRQSLFMIQKPENTIILDGTGSFDLAVPVEEEIGFEHVAVVIECFRSPSSTKCLGGLNGLQNSQDLPLRKGYVIYTITVERLEETTANIFNPNYNNNFLTTITINHDSHQLSSTLINSHQINSRQQVHPSMHPSVAAL